MLHETAKNLCNQRLGHIASAGTGFYAKNPAIQFTKDAKAGK